MGESRPQGRQPFCVSIAPHKICSVLALSPGDHERFPHTVLRPSAKEGPGNAKCSVSVCANQKWHCAQKQVASSSS